LKRVTQPIVFSRVQPSWGFSQLWNKGDLQGLPFLRDDRVVLECNLTVVMATPVSESRPMHMFGIRVPPSELVDNLGNLLEFEEGADVTFKVEDQVFHAHKIVLAMRSPVFKVQLYGPMSDKAQQDLTVEDMQPAIFKALLHYIYTDTLPVMDSLDEHEDDDMVKHLLAAADRYALERMKVMCEDILCRRLDVQSVAATLALADQHHCSKLKDACIQFINSLSLTGDLMASQGYDHLKRACPGIFVDIWEQSAKSRRMY
jgi:speckle-type POZ protein